MVERVRLEAGDVLDRDDALVGRLVGQRGAGDQVADRVDAFARRAQRAVDLDQAALVELDAGRVEAERLDVGPAARRDHEVLGLAFSSPGVKVTLPPRLDVLDERPVWTSMPCFLKPRPATREMSASSVGTTRSSASNSCTLAPSRRVAEAISPPDAPAPTTATGGGGPFSHDPIAGVMGDRSKRAMVAQMLGQAYMTAHVLIEHNKEAVERIAQVVIARKELHGNELVRLLDDAKLKIPKVDLTKEEAWPAIA